ncbi:MAG: tetratricopeptide repeat protein, partial [Gammaproteobacteria bacterium]|nr:tetratricopeptide repeat protein [Gammaproteobacteria bacterium]
MKGRDLMRVGVVVLLCALVTACELSVDESVRLQRAEQAFASNELRVAGIELKNVLRADPSNVTARVLLGRVSLAAGDPATAVKEFQRAGELGAAAEDYIVPLARALLATDMSDDVLELNVEELPDGNDQTDLIALQGNAYLLKGEFEKAAALFDRALERFSDHPDALIGSARISLENGDSTAAERALRRVISLNSDSHAAYAALARLKLNEVEYTEAEKNFQRAIELTSGSPTRREQITYMAGLVDSLLLQRKLGAAQDVARKMLEVAPDHPFALFQAGRADFESGRHDEAIEKAQRVITAYPEYQPARLLLAAAAMSKENFALAEVHLRSLLSDNPGNEMAIKLLAQTQLGLGSPDEAFSILQPLLQNEFVDPQTLAIAGSAGVSSGQTEQGLAYLAKSLQTGGLTDAAKLQAASS